jgi:lysozyme inhibitor LprI
LLKELEQAKAAVQRYLAAAVTRARERRADYAAMNMPGAEGEARTEEDELRKAYENFEAYRDALCASIGASYEGGSGGGDAQAACQVSLTRDFAVLLWKHFAPWMRAPS